MAHVSKPKKFLIRVRDSALVALEGADQKAVAVQIFILLVAVATISFFFNTAEDYQETDTEITALIEIGKAGAYELPTKAAPITQGIGALIVAFAFLLSLRLRARLTDEQRIRLTKIIFWITAFGVIVAWLPSDFAVTRSGIMGKAMAGELPSSWAYAGKLILIGLLILSFPIAVMLNYRSGIMDQYVMRNFLTPFAFCLTAFVSIFIIFDLLDNATDLAGASAGTVLKFYIVQLPMVIVFVLPATLLLSLLFSLGKMSTSNELISMIGAGRSVMRVLRPLFLVGLLCVLVSLVFKYEWGPNSVGYKESLLALIKQERLDKKNKKTGSRDAAKVAKLGWMHVNEVDNRTWFVGRVPRDLAKDKMTSVVIWQMGDDGQPDIIWKARTAKWLHGMAPPEWWLYAGKTYTYDDNGVPRVQSFDKLRLPGWRETPWKVLSSSQNAEHLGLPALTMYLKSNSDYTQRDLAPFLTNWWDTFAEPFWCFVMVLVSAPLGIVYSRRGVMGGVAASIVIFALMYVTRGTLISLGQATIIPAWIAAWGNNLIFATVGVTLLWFRSQNRELPKLKTILMAPFRRKSVVAKRTPSFTAQQNSVSVGNSQALGAIDGVLDSEALQKLDETLAEIAPQDRKSDNSSGAQAAIF